MNLALRQIWPGRYVARILAAATCISVLFTYFMITRSTGSLGPDPSKVWSLLVLNFVLLMTLVGIVGRRIWLLWQALKQNSTGSRLQQRVVMTFSLVTILPTMVISIFSVLVFNMGIQAWFNDRVTTAVNESLAVAEAYLAEHAENIRGDAIAMSRDLERFTGLAITDPIEFNRIVAAQAEIRSLTEVIVFQRNRIIAQGRLSFALAFENLPVNAIERANGGEVVLLTTSEDKVRALIQINGLTDGYLLIGRLIDSKVLNHMEKTQGAVNEYRSLKQSLNRLQTTFSLVFATLTLLLLLGSVWYGMLFASKLANPVTKMALAAERVRSGDYDARVETGTSDDEIASLARSFNRMTEQLGAQRSELMDANRKLDDRRRFSEAVLSGVSAGVLALDQNKIITLGNRSAQKVLLGDESKLEGARLTEISSAFEPLLTQAEHAPEGTAQGTVNFTRTDKRSFSLHARIAARMVEDHAVGFVVTFDDITPLVAAQRHAAWGDVARRVAHEIKNPLTPIALSAERLKRKYLKFIPEDETENFSKYTDTVARHVGDIGKMVEEFVSFARMPDPVFKRADMVEIIKKVLFSEQVAHPDIAYTLDAPSNALELLCDEGQLIQVFTNLLKNSAEAIESEEKNGSISISVSSQENLINVAIRDNGPGFPKVAGGIESMLEPYVTTRAKGTGLGLAIVKKIVEEHHGKIELFNDSDQGAKVTLSFLQQCDINAA